MAFNEDTRVKIPAILHLAKLGYEYISLSQSKWDKETNIFKDIFFERIAKINQEKQLEQDDIKKEYENISLMLGNEDLGKEFYEKIISSSGIKLIDFENFSNNSFHVVTELPCIKDDEEFRPDVTLLINGMPLVFIEVKKPNNREGILAERERINARFKNKKFRKFINISQILVFSNNMEYDTESITPIKGAFYSSTSTDEANFNCFREEETLDLSKLLKAENEELENFVLKDNGYSSIKYSPEFIENKEPSTPTNRIITSMFSRDRLAFLLKYGIAYVKNESGYEKHIMRYPQIFATKAIEKKLNSGEKKGIIWHTQGSGKTALAYFNVAYLTNFYQNQNTIPKFYFIVDRLDLMEQATREFSSRGLIVHKVNSRDDLLKDFRKKQAVHSATGKKEITVVNIQKFKDESNLIRNENYDTNTQRIYFLDEVHRSYDPKGSFLANLMTSDRNAILVGLTGTPLLLKDRKSTGTFGDYYHKYYYNSSIADGYTLKLIREGIESNYRAELQEILDEIKIKQGDLKRDQIFSHEKFVDAMLLYIINDFQKSRVMRDDDTIGGMVVCDSSKQAKKMHAIFAKKYSSNFTSALILHDEGTKQDLKRQIEDFKKGKIDLLFVYNMLLTGFDAKRLKKLYLGRVIKKHNLLQTLTRVNRPYKNHQFGYVVDFADIRKEFDATNKDYFDELRGEYGDDIEGYSELFMSEEDIEAEIENIKDKLFSFDLNNAENFSRQITAIKDKKQVLEIKKALASVRNLYNIIRLQGNYDLLDKIDFKKLSQLFNETARHLDLINYKESLENNVDSTNLLNVALENVIFAFRKVSEDELVIADELKNTLKKTREALGGNFDPKDKEFVSLYEELKRLFNKKNLDEISQEEMKENIDVLNKIYEQITELNRRNNLLKEKYNSDEKYARLHKRIREKGNYNQREITIRETLLAIKEQTDVKVLDNKRIMDNEGYFTRLTSPIVVNSFRTNKITLDTQALQFINSAVVKEYVNEQNGIENFVA